uniref:Uncharacterized protein n=1 Tax=Nelumbo nucifera TaxID=4432 RepID=A0A822Z4U3_NELNU|nr:TPA_asm: hypothetical protein HUJ06_014170 [Nelumbo nucifera]
MAETAQFDYAVVSLIPVITDVDTGGGKYCQWSEDCPVLICTVTAATFNSGGEQGYFVMEN